MAEIAPTTSIAKFYTFSTLLSIHLATHGIWPFIHLAMLQTNLVMIALGPFLTWPTFDVLPLNLADIFHLDLNIKTRTLGPNCFWPNYSFGQIMAKIIFCPKERCGQIIRMAKRNDTTETKLANCPNSPSANPHAVRKFIKRKKIWIAQNFGGLFYDDVFPDLKLMREKGKGSRIFFPNSEFQLICFEVYKNVHYRSFAQNLEEFH